MTRLLNWIMYRVMHWHFQTLYDMYQQNRDDPEIYFYVYRRLIEMDEDMDKWENEVNK